ncbi:MAG: succinate dehydrogenase cytochrome b subunit [Bryobacteraceae bacterium]
MTPQLASFYRAPIGKKAVMAVTGAILFGFVIGHLVGNLQIFLGPEKLDAYGRMLRSMPALLWTARLGLLAALVLHIVAAVELTALKRDARPVDYVKREAVDSTYASRTMMWSGPIVGAFVVYHLMHFTFGGAHPDFRELEVYRNVVTGFRSVPVVVAYVVAMAMLGMHLYHGAWSMFQSLGLARRGLRRFAAVSAWAISLGNISIPIAVVTGLIR